MIDIISYKLGKEAGGGGTPAVLINKNISANGTYNASGDEADGYKKVVVDVQPNLQNKSETITTNTTTTISADNGYDGLGEVSITTNVPEKTLTTKSITANGTYNASSDNADGYSSVSVSVSSSGGPDWSVLGYSGIPTPVQEDYNYALQIKNNYVSGQSFQEDKSLVYMPMVDTSSETGWIRKFYRCENLLYVPTLNTSNITDFQYAFYGCKNMKYVPDIDTSNAWNFYYLFGECFKINTIPELDFGKATKLTLMFAGSGTFTVVNHGGYKDVGKAYLTNKSANFNEYTVYVGGNLLTHESLMNVINKLYDIATKGCNTQSLTLGATNLAKLTAEEIAIATNKGWTVS